VGGGNDGQKENHSICKHHLSDHMELLVGIGIFYQLPYCQFFARYIYSDSLDRWVRAYHCSNYPVAGQVAKGDT
jgi:hypothetical protein